jgi:hypothetical protein
MIARQSVTNETGLKKRIAKNSRRAESRYRLFQGRELRAGSSQIADGGEIAFATASEYAVAAALWSVLAGLIIAVWFLLFDACWLTVPVRWGANFCPRPVEQGPLFAGEGIGSPAGHRKIRSGQPTAMSDATTVSRS